MTTAKVDLTVFARKFPHGLFPIARVSDVVLGENAQVWATEVKQRLTDELRRAKIPGGGLVDDNLVAGAITALFT